MKPPSRQQSPDTFGRNMGADIELFRRLHKQPKPDHSGWYIAGIILCAVSLGFSVAMIFTN